MGSEAVATPSAEVRERTAGRGQSLSPQPTNLRKNSQNASTARMSPASQQTSPRSPPIQAIRSRQKSWRGSLRSETPPPQKLPDPVTLRSRERLQTIAAPATVSRGSGRASPSRMPVVTREEMEQEAQRMLILENSTPGEAPPSSDFVPVDLDQEPADFDLLATAASFISYSCQSESHSQASQATQQQRSSATLKSVSTSGIARVDIPSTGTNGTKRAPTTPTSRSPVSRPRTATTSPTKSSRLASTAPAALQVAPSGVPSHSALRAAARAAARAPFSNIPSQSPERPKIRLNRTPSPRLLSSTASSRALAQHAAEASQRSSTTRSQVSSPRVSPAQRSPSRASPSSPTVRSSTRQEPVTPRVQMSQTLPARPRAQMYQSSTAASRSQTSSVRPRVQPSQTPLVSSRVQAAPTSPVRARVATSPTSPVRTHTSVFQASTAASRSRSRPAPSSPSASRHQPPVGKRSLTSPGSPGQRFPPASAALQRQFVSSRVAQMTGKSLEFDSASKGAKKAAGSADAACASRSAEVFQNLEAERSSRTGERTCKSYEPEDGHSGRLSTQVVDSSTQTALDSECMLPIPSKHTSASQTPSKTDTAAGSLAARAVAPSENDTAAASEDLLYQASSEHTAQTIEVDQGGAPVDHHNGSLPSSLPLSTSCSADPAQSRGFQTWKSFGNRTFNWRDSLSSSQGSGCLESGNADTAQGDEPSPLAEMIRTSVRNPLRETATSQPAVQVQSTEGAESIAGAEPAVEVEAITVPNESIHSNVSCSSSNEPSAIGASGSLIFYLPAPRESFLRRTGEDSRDLVSIWSTVHRTTSTSDHVTGSATGARPQPRTADSSTAHDTASSQLYGITAVQEPNNEEPIEPVSPRAGPAALPPISSSAGEARMQDISDKCGRPDQVSPSDTHKCQITSSESLQNQSNQSWHPILNCKPGVQDQVSQSNSAASSNAADLIACAPTVHALQSVGQSTSLEKRSLGRDAQIKSSLDLYGVHLQPSRSSIEGAHPSVPDCHEISACLEASKIARSGVICASHPLASSVRSIPSVPGSVRHESGNSSKTSIISCARNNRRCEWLTCTIAFKTNSSWALITSTDGDAGASDSTQQTIPEHLRAVSVEQNPGPGRAASWLTQTVATARTLSKGHSQEMLAATNRVLGAQDERTVESSADILNTLNLVQDCHELNACVSVPDSAGGTGDTSAHVCAGGPWAPLQSHRLDGTLTISDAERSSNSSVSQIHNHSATDSTTQQGSSRPVTAADIGLEDPSGPFPAIYFSLPVSQQPGPTPKSQIHGKELSTSMGSSRVESPEQIATSPAPCATLTSAPNSSRQEGSRLLSDTIEESPEATASSLLLNAALPSRLKPSQPPQPAAVRLTRESCFSGDSLARVYNSSTGQTLNESTGSQSKSSGSESGSFSLKEDIEQSHPSRASRQTQESAAQRPVALEEAASKPVASHQRSDKCLPTVSKYSDFRCTEMVIGKELEDLLADTGADSKLEMDGATNRVSQVGFEHPAQNSAFSHPVMFDPGQQDDLEHIYTQVVRPSSTFDGHESTECARESSQRARSQQEGDHQPRSSSPFAVERSNFGEAADTHDSTMSGMSSSMWTLSKEGSPEPTFKAATEEHTAVHPSQPGPDSPEQPQNVSTTNAGNGGPDSHALLHSERSLLSSSSINTSTKSVAIQSISGWNNLTGQISSEVASLANTPPSDSAGATDEDNTYKDVHGDQNSASQIAQEPVPPSLMTEDPTVKQESTAGSTLQVGLPAVAGGAGDAGEEPDMVLDSAPVSLNSPSILATLCQMQPATACVPSGKRRTKGAQGQKRGSPTKPQLPHDEFDWGDVEAAWAIACDAATQIPVLAVLLSPFIPAPIPRIVPFVSPFHSPQLAFAPWALGIQAQMEGYCAVTPQQEGTVNAGVHLDAQLATGHLSSSSKPLHVQHPTENSSQEAVVSADVQYPARHQSEHESSQQAAVEPLSSHPLVLRASEDQLLEPAVLSALSSTPDANAPTCLEAIAPEQTEGGPVHESKADAQISPSLPSVGAAVPGLPTMGITSFRPPSIDIVLKDLETYASIGHEERAQIHGAVATKRNGPLSLFHRGFAAFAFGTKNTDTSCAAVCSTPGPPTSTSALSTEPENPDAGASTLGPVQDANTQADHAEPESSQPSVSAGPTIQDASISLHQTCAGGKLMAPESTSKSSLLSAQSHVSSSAEDSLTSSLFQDTISLPSVQLTQPAQGAGYHAEGPRLSISSLSDVGITPEVLKSLALPCSDEDLQALTTEQQRLMIKLFLGKDSTVREAAKELHQQANVSGQESVSSILRASAARSALSTCFTGCLDRSTADSINDSVYASSSVSAPIQDSDSRSQLQGLGSLKISKQALLNRKDALTRKGEHSDAVMKEGEVTAADENASSNHQRRLLTKRIAYTALILSVILSGLVWATDGDIIGEVLDRMHRGASKGAIRSHVERRRTS